MTYEVFKEGEKIGMVMSYEPEIIAEGFTEDNNRMLESLLAAKYGEFGFWCVPSSIREWYQGTRVFMDEKNQIVEVPAVLSKVVRLRDVGAAYCGKIAKRPYLTDKNASVALRGDLKPCHIQY